MITTINTINPSFSQHVRPLGNRKRRYAIVVPCYNEAERFPYRDFLSFARRHPEVLLCFVNDGSTDKTLSVLRGIQAESSYNICVCDLAENSGKSEAVRQGILYVYQNFDVSFLGFLDADMATTPEEWLEMARYKQKFPQFGAIVGSRIPRLGANITRNDGRSIGSSIIKKFIRVILKTSFQDSQCGAKIFQRNLIPFLFGKPFLTSWLFDVEIFLRLQEKFGQSTLSKGVLEFPLMRWTEIGGSKLGLRDYLKMPVQLVRLYYYYRVAGKLDRFFELLFAYNPNRYAYKQQ